MFYGDFQISGERSHTVNKQTSTFSDNTDIIVGKLQILPFCKNMNSKSTSELQHFQLLLHGKERSALEIML